MIPQEILDQIQDRCDIVELINSYIPLKRTGRNFKALCPFHHEKTPSFVVSPDKQIYHCFGCGAGGGVFNFLMKYERMEFMEAVKTLAQKCGVELPRRELGSPEKRSDTSKIYSANELAAHFYHQSLVKAEHGRGARNYLKRRAVKDEIVGSLKLGYAPQSWDGLLSHARTKGAHHGILKKAGLVLAGKEGRYYDRFRNRLIFPIFNIKGSVVGFGGRVLDESQPKYINSPETEVYSKGRHLYGLNFAVEYLKDKDSCVIVEGYLDFLTPYQSGIRNIVASLGTALTPEQIRLLKRYTKNVTMIFDADQAGESAALRGLDLLVEEGLNVQIVSLPEGYDPDNFVREKGAGGLLEKIHQARNLFDYKLGLLLIKYDTATLEDKAKIAAEMLPTIARVPNAVLKSEYIKKLAESLKLKEDALWTELKKVRKNYTGYVPTFAGIGRRGPAARSAERLLLGLLLEDGQLMAQAKVRLKACEIKDGSIRKAVETIFQFWDKGKSIHPDRLISKLQDESVELVISEICAQESLKELANKEKCLMDCIKRIKQQNLQDKLKLLQSEIKSAQAKGNEKEVVELVSQYSSLMKGIGC